MADPKEIQETIERVVGEVFDNRASTLRSEIVERVQKTARESLDRAGSDLAGAITDRTQKAAKEAERAQHSAKEEIERGQKAAKEEMDRAQKAAKEEMDRGQKAAKEAMDGAQKAAKEAMDGAQKTAKEAMDGAQKAAKEAIDGAQKVAKEAMEGVQKAAREGLEGASRELSESVAEQVKNAVRETLERASGELTGTIERVAGEVFDLRAQALRGEIVERAMKAVEPLLAPPPKEEAPASTVMESCITAIEEGTTQAEILKALLEGAAKFTGRVALFVVKGNSATLWQGRGFEDNDAIKGTAVDATSGLASRALQDSMPVAAAAAEFDSGFVEKVGNPSEGNALLVPMVVRDKTPALVYADSGAGGTMDAAAVQVLVRAAGHWVELIASRKAGAAAPAEAAASPAEAATEPEPEPAAEEPAHPAAHGKAHGAAAAIAPGEEEVHKKAKRFAKLLVDEIKLYNQAKVTEGKKHKDLYDRLKEDIDKSRATYEKRYGGTPAAGADYFNKEVVRILADNDASLLGANFSH